MDYSRPILADRLASEYVLGTLRGPARRRFEVLLPAHPALRTAVARWEARLVPLAGSVAPIAPSAAVWSRVQQRVFKEMVPTPWWRKLGMWRGASAVATVAALAFALQLAQRKPEVTAPTLASSTPIIVVIAPNPEAAAVLHAGFAAGIAADGRSIVIRPLHDVAPGTGRALELWAVPAQGAPRSLGLVSGSGSTTVERAALLQNTAAFAVSLEPAGGSPSGAPTGPIVSVGKLEI